MTRLLLILAVLLISTIWSSAQNTTAPEEFESGFIPYPKGALILFSGTQHSFSVDIVSDSVRPTEQPNFVLVDGQVVQCINIGIPEDIDVKDLDDERTKEILRGYIDYELAYFKDELEQDYENLSIDYVVINKRLFAVWSLEMPKLRDKVEKQIYMTTVCFNQILNLNSPVVTGSDAGKAKQKLMTIAETLRTYDTHLDFQLIHQTLNDNGRDGK